MSKYMMVLVLSGVVPFCLSFFPPLKFYRHVHSLFYSISLVVLIFGAWDIFAAWRGHWQFNPQAVGGIKIVNLPLEEVLFFVVIPFSCIFTWEVILYVKSRIR